MALWFFRDQAEHRKTRQLIRAVTAQLEVDMTAAFDRLDASFDGISGDINGLKDAASALAAKVADLTAGQDAAVAAGVDAALAEFNARADATAAKYEGLDSETDPVPAPEV